MFAVGFVLFVVSAWLLRAYTHPWREAWQDYVFGAGFLLGCFLMLVSVFIKLWDVMP